MKTNISKKITINECKSIIWQYLTIFGFLASILFIVLYSFYPTPFGGGILRLLAFAGFALGIIGFLQMRGRAEKIILEIKNDQLVINYFLSGKKNQEEFFELPTIARIDIKQAPPALGFLPRHDIHMLQAIFTDTDKELSLLRFEGHDVFLSQAEALKANHFLKDQLLSKMKA